jgi:hypothetical protein
MKYAFWDGFKLHDISTKFHEDLFSLKVKKWEHTDIGSMVTA